MRWIWFDRFVEFESGKRAVAVKNVTLAEDHLHDHFPGYPIMPHSLMIEGMAQTAGILVGEARGFSEKVILAKVKRAEFFTLVRPGDTIRYQATVDGEVTASGASTTGRIFVGEEPVGEVDLVFSHIDKNMSGLEFPEENFVFTGEFQALLKTYRQQGGAKVAL
ncbi:MAG: beta-hydroxyacyl-ACP dehydratase [Planctomycetes bacterium]|nr:beta-hydroxyacyl-ACP dehydratase [Planctomycetota bacterium]